MGDNGFAEMAGYVAGPVELVDRVIDVMHKPPTKAREHEASPDCWCHPTLNCINPETGAQHWIHHEPN